MGVGVVRVRTVEEHVDAEDADELLEDREGDLDLFDCRTGKQICAGSEGCEELAAPDEDHVPQAEVRTSLRRRLANPSSRPSS